MEELLSKIENETATIGVIGLGYVGLPLSLLFAEKFSVFGVDINPEKIRALQEGISYVENTKSETLKKYLNVSFFPKNDFGELERCDFIIICVPTPLNEKGEPDLTFIKKACLEISKRLRKGQFIILESTTYPGTTEEVVFPVICKAGLKLDVDLGIAFSPERINPGTEQHVLRNTPKVVGGLTPKCTDIASKLYGKVINAKIVKVRNARTAEATKMLENIYRNVNIALVNELALIFEKMDINIWEVIDAASSKPFAFDPHYPGPGVGGHCIPLDPIYMSYKAKKFGFIPRFIELSREINEYMKIHTVNKVQEGLSQGEINISDSRIAVLGLAYKGNIGDTRESPSKEIIEELINLGAAVKVYDPFAKSINTFYGEIFSEKNIEDCLKNADCAIFVTDHILFKNVEIEKIRNLLKFPFIVDCRNIFPNKLDGLLYIGIGKGKTG